MNEGTIALIVVGGIGLAVWLARQHAAHGGFTSSYPEQSSGSGGGWASSAQTPAHPDPLDDDDDGRSRAVFTPSMELPSVEHYFVDDSLKDLDDHN